MPVDKVAPSPVTVAIHRTNPRDIPLIYANDFAMSHIGRDVFLTFSQAQPPIDLAPSEMSSLKSIDAIAVANIVITQELAQAIIKIMTENLPRGAEEGS